MGPSKLWGSRRSSSGPIEAGRSISNETQYAMVSPFQVRCALGQWEGWATLATGPGGIPRPGTNRDRDPREGNPRRQTLRPIGTLISCLTQFLRPCCYYRRRTTPVARAPRLYFVQNKGQESTFQNIDLTPDFSPPIPRFRGELAERS